MGKWLLFVSAPICLSVSCGFIKLPLPQQNEAVRIETNDIEQGGPRITPLDSQQTTSLWQSYSSFTARPLEAPVELAIYERVIAIQSQFPLSIDSPMITDADRKNNLLEGGVVYEHGPHKKTFLIDFLTNSVLEKSLEHKVGYCGNGKWCEGLKPAFPENFTGRDLQIGSLRAYLRDMEIVDQAHLDMNSKCFKDLMRGDVERFRVFYIDKTYHDYWFLPACANKDGTLGTVPKNAVTWVRDSGLRQGIVELMSKAENEWPSSFEFQLLKKKEAQRLQAMCDQGSRDSCRCLAR